MPLVYLLYSVYKLAIAPYNTDIFYVLIASRNIPIIYLDRLTGIDN